MDLSLHLGMVFNQDNSYHEIVFVPRPFFLFANFGFTFMLTSLAFVSTDGTGVLLGDKNKKMKQYQFLVSKD